MPKLDVYDYTGGVNNHIEPHLINNNNSQELVNCNVTSGSVVSRNQSESYQIKDTDLELINQTGDRSLVRFSDTIFWSDNVTGEIDSTLGYVGIDPPTTQVVGTPHIPGDRFEGSYRYVTTFVTSDGLESASGEPDFVSSNVLAVLALSEARVIDQLDVEEYSRFHLFPGAAKREGYEEGQRVRYLGRFWEAKSNFSRKDNLIAIFDPHALSIYWKDITELTVEVTGYQSIKLNSFPTPSTVDITDINIYRTQKNGSDFFYLDTIPVGTSSYIDEIPDEQLLLGRTLKSVITAFPPLYIYEKGSFIRRGGKFLSENNGVFFLAHANRLYFSEVGDPHSWNPSKNLRFEADITGIANAGQELLIFTENRIYRVKGDVFESTYKIEVPDVQGVKDWRTISNLVTVPVWISNDGLCIYGQGKNFAERFITLVTKDVFDFTESPVWGVSANQRYYAMQEDSTIVFDFRYGLQITKLDYSGDYAFYNQEEDDLIFVNNGLYTIADPNSGTPLAYTILSKEYTFGEISSIKNVKKLDIVASSDVTVDVYIDGEFKYDLTSVRVNRDRRVLFLKSGGIFSSISFKFRGTGTFKGFSIYGYGETNQDDR